jgi:hypothetical protein
LTRRARPRAPALPVSFLREAAAREVASRSLRSVAREIGLSPNGLRNFLHGAEPRPATRVKLERWLASRRRGHAPRVSSLVRLLGELGEGLRPEEVSALGRRVAAFLEELYRTRGQAPPAWIRDLAAHYGASDPVTRT